MGNLEAGLFLLKRNSQKKPHQTPTKNQPHWDLRNEITQKSSFQYWCASTIDTNVFCYWMTIVHSAFFQSQVTDCAGKVTDCAGIRWEASLPWSYITVCDFATATSFKPLFPPSLGGTFLYELDVFRFFELVFHTRHCLTAWNYWIPRKFKKKKSCVWLWCCFLLMS